MALLVVACSPSVDTQGRASRWLFDLGLVQCRAQPVVSFSADRNWMLCWIEHFQPDSGVRDPMVADSDRGVMQPGKSAEAAIVGPMLVGRDA